jgi:ABC-type transport system involved in multi-copper enzyme maturation permease subunit
MWLLEKEWRELMSSRAFWVMLLLTGPLVGVSFISAVTTYAELSGLNGTSAGVGEAFSPLIGVWGPTFSSYEIVAAFLLPFVGIRMVSSDRQSGALKLEMQQPLSPLVRIVLKGAVLLTGWVIASLASALALVLWAGYGGSLHWPEIFAIALGHLLNAGLTIALAAACASLAEHPATAAILTLSFTVGTWVISFVAAVQGGAWERVAGYTPPVMVAAFQHGLIEADVVLIALVLIATGLAIAAVWMKIGESVRQRAVESFAVIGVAAIAMGAASFVHQSFDASENRYNSFSVADEETLERIRKPLAVEIHLAPEDPRRYDFDRNVLSKLRRVVPGLSVHYVSSTSTGLFEQTADHYGEIWYQLGDQKAVSRETNAEGALENIFALAALTPPPQGGPVFRGHPLAARPTGAAPLFYFFWPTLVAGAGLLVFRRPR